MNPSRVLVVAAVGIVALALGAASVLGALAQPVQITIAQPAEATTMDPGRSTQVLTVNYFYNLYDSLTRWDASLTLQPGLATGWRAVNDTTWELTLRPGVKFHDGAPLTADDVKATLERNLVPGKTGVTAGFTTIEAVQAVNPGLVRIITKKADPLLPVRMAQMGSQILPARLTTDEGVKELARRPVGTGAYRFVEWVKDERLVMEANRDWWGWEGRKPGVDRVVWKPIPEDFPRLVALDRGEADIVTNVPPDRIKAIAEGRTTRIVSVPLDVTLHAGMGTMVNDKQLIEVLADMWAKAGIRAKIAMLEMGARQKMVNDRAIPVGGLLLINPQSTLLDADGSLWRLLHPTGLNGKYWAGSQPGHRFHDLMEQARYSLDPARRKQLYAEATQLVSDEKPWLELFQEVIVYGTSQRVTFKPRADYRLIAAEMQVTR